MTGEDGTAPEALAAEARRIVLVDHTGRARARDLVRMLHECPERESLSEEEETA